MNNVSRLQSRTRCAQFEQLESRTMLSISPGWLDTVGGPANTIFAYVAAHDAGGASVTGRFEGTVNFDSGPGKTELSNSGPLFDGASDMVVARYGSAGDLLWARRIGS